jgi:hypothetical protein
LKACKAGALENALMDAECARADIERLRDEVWEKLEERHTARGRGRVAGTPVKAFLGAVLLVLTAATPVALIQESLSQKRQERETVTLEWVTPDEKTLLGNLRKHLSDSNPFASIQQPQEPPPRQPELPPRTVERGRAVGAVPKQEPEFAVGGDVMEIAMEIPYDRIISLVQAGEKAMKNGEPAIKIEK